MRWFLPAVALLMVVGCAGPDPFQGQSKLAARVSARYGRVGRTLVAPGDSPRLELHLTGRRWRGMRTGVSDSARAVARYTLANLPDEMQRPDTIVVTFLTDSRNFVIASSSQTMGDTLAVADL